MRRSSAPRSSAAGWKTPPSASAPPSTTAPSSTSPHGYQNQLSAEEVRSRRDHRQALPYAARHVAYTDYRRWSLYGAPWLQPVASGGKSNWRGTRQNKRKPLPWVASSCARRLMVRRGSTVRVRQRASGFRLLSRYFR